VIGRGLILAVVAAAVLIAGAPAVGVAQEKTITVFAAASMKNALDDVNSSFTKQSGIKVVASYAASSALMKQIEQGAPADVFLSADVDWMDYGAKHNLIRNDTRLNLLGNRLVLIAPKDSKVTEVKIGGMKAFYLDVSGTYKHKDAPFDPKSKEELKPGYRRLNVHYEGKNDAYHIRLVGPAATVEHYKKGFDEWLKNFKK